ncbi:MAG: tryptophan synthase subunit alpha [Rhodospirillales bacterium]|nr:MAG: tryptophan synthase subunit alpha [Rhodospirillales bacterium]
MTGNGRLARRFRRLSAEGRAGLVTFVTAGDPNPDISREMVCQLPTAGADIIELGMPFSDPMADGPAIQQASLRALRAGQTMARTFAQVAALRTIDTETPVVLMGYFNPIYRYGVDRFAADAATAGVDGLIVVDLPPEEHDELRLPATAAGLDLVALVAPTTDDARLPRVVGPASGFVYYVSIAGITGTASAAAADIAPAVTRIRRTTGLPIAVGFGIRTPEQTAAVAAVADAAVVGSAIVDRIAESLGPDGTPVADPVASVGEFVAALAAGARSAQRRTASGAGAE